MIRIPFNKPYFSGLELDYIKRAHGSGRLSGDGPFTQSCQRWLESKIACSRALLTHSCTAALEMAALLSDFAPGDEVIVPSFTFVSTANAFAMRGLVPVFVDVRPDTLNIEERNLEEALTEATRAICVVHYAGVAADLASILTFAERHNLMLIEDAAQALMATYQGRSLGSFGTFATLSFHETKNITCGEGGALLVNEPAFCRTAEIAWEKGTDRSSFSRGEVDRYTWQDLGSSYLPGEITASFLMAQLEVAHHLTRERMRVWEAYWEQVSALGMGDLLQLPTVPHGCVHNAHTFYILLNDRLDRSAVLKIMNAEGVNAVFHYQALHSSPGGRRLGRASGNFENTDRASSQLIRLPLWVGLSDSDIERVVSALSLAVGIEARVKGVC